MTLAATFDPVLIAVDRRPWDRHFRTSAAFCLALLAITIPVRLIDERLLNGVSVWSKPVKFQISLALHFAMLALIASRLSPPFRTGIWMTLLALAAMASLGFELGYIMLQAAKQEASRSTPCRSCRPPAGRWICGRGSGRGARSGCLRDSISP